MSLEKEKLQKKIIEKLRENPIVSYACKQTGLSRTTLYRWLEDDALFKKAYQRAIKLGKINITEVAKLKLMGLMNSPDQKIALDTVKFYLNMYDPEITKRRWFLAGTKSNRDSLERESANKEIEKLQEMFEYLKTCPSDKMIGSQEEADAETAKMEEWIKKRRAY